MKTPVKIVVLLFAVMLLQNCSEEDATSKGKIQFNFNFLTDDDAGNGRTQQAIEFPEGSYALVTIEANDGTVIYDSKKLDLLKIGDRYTTIPLEFNTGGYRLTDFLILTQGNEILYATPKSGAPLASLTSHPLPISFAIGANRVADLDIEVVDAEAQTPEAFGYASFGVNVLAGPEFSLAVFITDANANIKFTKAKASVIKNGEVIHTQAIASKVTALFFDGDPDATYTLEILKEGYARYTKEFVLEDLLAVLDGSPLSVVLTNALTFQPLVFEDFTFDMTGPAGSQVTVDWGDGTVENSVSPNSLFYHTYTGTGPYFVSVTGDIDQITGLQFYYSDSDIGQLSIIHLTELMDFSMGYMRSPATVDLSNNTKLVSLNLEGNFLTSLDISSSIFLRRVAVGGNNFSTSEIDKMINHMHHIVVTYGVTEGIFSLPRDLYDEEFIGPPSAASLVKLEEMQKTYGWFIYPIIP